MNTAEIAACAYGIKDWSRFPNNMEARIGNMMLKSVPAEFRPKRLRVQGGHRTANPATMKRNAAILKAHAAGATVSEITSQYGISKSHVWNILRGRKGALMHADTLREGAQQ